MKMKCEQCGTRFDADEYMYICPKCSHYHSQVNRSTYTMSSDEAPERPAAAGSKKDRSELFAEESRPSEKNRLQKVLCLLIILCMVLLPFLYHNWANGKAEAVYQAQKAGPVPEETAELGKAMNLGALSLTVTKIQPFSYDGIAAPEGWKYIRADFTTRFADQLSWNNDTEISLEYDGIYYSALSSYSLTEDSDLQTSLEDSGLETDAGYEEEGFWVFIVPEDAADCRLRICLLKKMDQEDSYSMSRPSRICWIDFSAKGGSADD